MAKQNSFKKKIRQRMIDTGQRYLAARAALMEEAEAATKGARKWISLPEVGDDAVRAATGHGWDQWCDIIENWDGHRSGHQPIAKFLAADKGVDPWWAQTITVGFERITGLRLPGQMADGTFSVNKSKTVAIESRALRICLLDKQQRRMLFPNQSTELRSKPESKAIRLAIGPGIAIFRLEDASNCRTKLAIQHTKLPSIDDADQWRFYWAEWVEALADSADDS